MTVNKVILVGNLGRDPEVRSTQSGTSVCNLNIATSERRKDREGQWNDHTEWHRVVCFGRTAENAGRFLQKGRQVYIEGRLRTNKWQDKDGQDRWSTDVVADVLQFLGGRQGQGQGQGAGGGFAPPAGGGGQGGGFGGGQAGGFGGGQGGGFGGGQGGGFGGPPGGGYGGGAGAGAGMNADDDIPF